MKKAGQNLDSIYVIDKWGGLTKLTHSGQPDLDDSTTNPRSNQSVNKTLENAKKIYRVDLKDLIDSDPEKAADRLSNQEVRQANLRLGHDRPRWDSDTRGGSYYAQSKRAQARNSKEIARLKADYESGDISRKEMEAGIERLKNNDTANAWDVRNYNEIRNKNAKNRYAASRQALQKPFNDLEDAKRELRDAKRDLQRSQDNLDDATTGSSRSGWSSSEYASALSKIEDTKKKIADLQKTLDYYQQIVDSGAQDKDIEKFTQDIKDQQARIDSAQAKIDALLRRK